MRRNILQSRTIAENGEATPASTQMVTAQPQTTPVTPSLASRATQPVGALGKSLSALSERGKYAEEIEKKLAAGAAVVELDPATILPSFIADRMLLDDESLADLIDGIRTNGQLSPILVRPHPEKPGYYQTAFGHRRLRAVALIGIPVRAVVRDLSDEDMAIAQGQENQARKDLSYIEKVRFAQRLEARFSRDIVMQALSVYKTHLSIMLSVAHSVPEDISNAVGPASNTGRRGWIELAERLKDPNAIDKARKLVQNPQFAALDSDSRFKRLLAALSTDPAKRKLQTLKTADGGTLARVRSGARRVVLEIDRKQTPDFADFVLNQLPALYADYTKSKTNLDA